MHKLVELFCDVDDFCAVFMPAWEKTLLADGTRKRQRVGRMAISEVMTIIVLFHMSSHRDFKNFYSGYLARFYKADFPDLLSYNRFIEVMPAALIPLCSYFASLKSDPTGIEFIDSTSIKVCHN
ncbi:MAG: IS982 family transposase, partial [Vibrionaceae bacterium]